MTPDAYAPLASYRSRGERLTEQAQTKLTLSEKERLIGFVDYAREHGIDITTPAAAVRYFVVSGLDAIDAQARRRMASECVDADTGEVIAWLDDTQGG